MSDGGPIIFPASMLSAIAKAGEGGSVEATLWVQGVEIAGTIVPLRDYYRWALHNVAKAITETTTGDPEDVELLAAQMVEDFSGEDARYLAVRDAEVRRGPSSEWHIYPFILVGLQYVGACTPSIAIRP